MKNTVKILLEMIKENKIDFNDGILLLQSIKYEENLYTCEKDMAVIGMSLKMPDADNKEEFWNNISFGKCSIGDLPEKRKEDMMEYLKFMGETEKVEFSKGGYLDNIDEFDYKYFNISPKEASLMSPSQRLFLQIAWNTLIDAGYEGKRIVSSRTGVFIGYSADELIDYKKIILDTQPESLSEAMIGNTSSVIASRIAYLLDLKGPVITVDTACSSSLVALHLACKSIRNKECDMAIAGGINLNLLRINEQLDVGIQSNLGKVRAFDEQADGTLIGEGIGAVLIKPLEKALKDGDNIYAVIKGSAVNQDGKSVGLTAPNAEAQENVIIDAWKDADIDPTTISYIETHGTGTKLGDPVEITGIERAFKRYTNLKQFCGISSLKTNIGHLDQSAGIAGFIKATLSLKNKQLAPSLHFSMPNKKIDFINSPIYVVDRLQNWDSEKSVRRCGISSFGISGTNCHVVLEEAPERKDIIITEKPYLFTLSAKNENVLNELIIKYLIALTAYKKSNISNIIYTANTGCQHNKCRIAIVADSKADLIFKLRKIVLDQEQVNYSDIFTMYNNTKINYNNEPQNNLELARYLALSYVLGEEMDWDKWYIKEEHYIKESIVEYPFENNRCWLKIQNSSGGYGKKLTEPLLDRYLGSALNQQIFIKNINVENEWVLKEHKIKGNYVLVGTAYIEMILETLKYYTNYESIEISDVIFSTPFTMKDLEQKRLEIIIYRECEEYSFTIVSKVCNEKEETWIKHVEGRIKILNIQKQNNNISEIIHRCKNKYKKPDLLHLGVSSYMEFGYHWDNITDMYIGNNESISLINANSIVRDELDKFILHPALLDNALATENVEEKSKFLPFKYGSIVINGNLPNVFYSHVRVIDKGKKETIKFNIDIMDLKGNVLVKIRNYIQKKFNKIASGFLNQIHWKESQTISNRKIEFIDEKVLIISDEEEYANNIVSQISLHNRVIVCHSFSDISFEKIKRDNVHHIIYISGIDNINKESINHSHIYGKITELFIFVKKLMELKIRKRLDFYIITLNSYNILGDIKVCPINTAILGFARVISQEYNNIKCHCIDTNYTVSEDCIVNEIYHRYYENEVAYHNNIRYLKELTTLKSEDYPNRELKFSEEGIYIITGGVGAIGLETVKYLQTKGVKNVALLNRRSLPKRELWEDIIKIGKCDKTTSIINNIIFLEKKGINIECIAIDITDFSSLEKVMTDLRKRYGLIKAVIHSAGIAGDGFIKNKSTEKFLEVLKPKISGIINMDILTKEDNLDFILLYSAGTSILGTPGQSDYTVANAYLDGYSSYLKWSRENVISINWAAWKEVGMAVDYKSNVDGILKAISTKDAIESLNIAMEKSVTSVIIGELNVESDILKNKELHIELSENIKESIRQTQKKEIIKSYSQEIQLMGKEKDEYSETERIVGNAFSEILGFLDINIYDDIYSMGGDSLTSMHILKKINKHMKIQLEVADFFEYPSVFELSSYIDKISTLDEESSAMYKEISQALIMDNYPLTSSQERIYIAESLEQNLLLYNNLDIWRVDGELDIEVLKNAVEMLVEKHEILRTGFLMYDGKIRQKIYEKGEYEFTILEHTDNLEEVITKFERPFNLERPELIRFKVIKNFDSKQYILIDIHHIIYDGMSTQILINDLVELYKLKQMVLLPIQYKDFAVFQEQYYLSEEFNKQKKFWLNKFSEKVPLLDMPTDYIRSGKWSYKGDTLCYTLNDNILNKINQLASRTGTTVYIILLAVFNILLSKYASQNDIVIGTPVHGRTKPGLDKMIGIFINIILMRNDVDKNKKFVDFLQDVKNNAFDAYSNQDYPYDRLINDLRIQREANHNPIFDVMFNFINFAEKKVTISGLEFRKHERYSHTSKYDLTLIVLEKSNELVLEFEYSIALFKKETITKMLNHYLTILVSVLSNENIIVKNIEMISDIEREFIFNNFNQKEFEYFKEESIQELIINQAKSTPDSIALISDNDTITYKQLDKKSSLVANYLIQKGVTRNKIVALMCNRNFDMIIGILGILKAGGAYLPIDSTYPLERIQYMLEDSKTELLLTNLLNTNKIEFSGETIKLSFLEENQNSNYLEKEFPLVSNKNDLAYVIYTSGSSGKPKGVMIEHQAVINFIKGIISEINFNVSNKILNLTTVSFDIFVLEVFVPLSQGMQIVIANEEEQLNFEMLGKLIMKNSIDMLQVTPSRLQLMLENKHFVQCVDCIKTVMVGGETLSSFLLAKIKTVFSNASIYNMYGPTETTVWSSVKRLESENSITVGKPIINTKMYIMSDEQLVPAGIKGELCIGGVGLARGYWNRDELTNEKFIKNPFEQNSRLYRTGDIAKWLSNGEVELYGRMDHQVKLRGYRIELEEIENKLMLIPEIYGAVVIIKEEKADQYLCAFIVTNSKIQIKLLRKELEKFLPAYMIPSVFTIVDKFPTTANGKINRKELDNIDIYTKTDSTEEDSLTEIENYVLSIWVQVLGHSKINKEDNFFDIGGTSFNLLRMNNMMQEKYPGIVKVTDLFENPTIEKMALYLEDVTSIHNLYDNIPLMKLPDNFYSNNRKSSIKNNAVLSFAINTDELNEMMLIIRLKISNFLLAIYSFVIMRICKSNNIILYYGLDNKEFKRIKLDLSDISDFDSLFKKVEVMENMGDECNVISTKDILNVIQRKTNKDCLLTFGECTSINNQVINYGDIGVEYLISERLVHINIHYNQSKYRFNEIENLKNMYYKTLYEVICNYLNNN